MVEDGVLDWRRRRALANTLPRLHPDGYLEVQDIVVSDMDDDRRGLRGPGSWTGRL